MHPVEKIRNLAIIAHIDHGKTTLIDSIFKATRLFRDNAKVEERVMDSGDIERERGITITSKHCTVEWEDYLINIVDTPGHADFSGEVERVLSMVNSVLLLVDANEGPMPQTRYVLSRALALGLNPIVVVNKVDRSRATPEEALDKTIDLFIELGANESQLDFPVLYGSGLDGWLVNDLSKPHEGMTDLFETIKDYVAAPEGDATAPYSMQVSTLAWNEYVGQIGCGRIISGVLKKGEPFHRTQTAWKNSSNKEAGWDIIEKTNERATHIWVTRGLDRIEVESAFAGDIVWISGPKKIDIGDTFAAPDFEQPPFAPLEIEEPTVSMFFLVNNGPFAGRNGTPLTLRQLKARLEKETHHNVALKVEDLGRPDGVKVSGRGELQLAILIEEIIRENSEICASRPEVITKIDKNGKITEPIETLMIEVPEEFQGIVIEKLAKRKAELTNMITMDTGVNRLEFEIPTRGLIGYRGDFLTDTRGLGIMSSRLKGYAPWRGEIISRNRGSIVSIDTGVATGYQLQNLQERGALFLSPGTEVYNGQVVGENARPGDMPCNPTKKKQTTNHRAACKDMGIKLDVPRKLTLDKALEWIADDELVEATPKEIRVRKTILDMNERKKSAKKANI